jgi:hypothetical protein
MGFGKVVDYLPDLLCAMHVFSNVSGETVASTRHERKPPVTAAAA